MIDTAPRKPDAALFWRLLLAGYWIALLVGTHLPPTFRGLPGNHFDKLVHAAAYAGLAWLLAMAWQSSTGWLNGRHLRFVWVAVVLFAIADEITQVPFGRDASLWDLLADAVGATMGIYLFKATRRIFDIN